jgi:hypothetical protein
MWMLWTLLALVTSGQDHHAKQRGATIMGFDQDKTAHHFLLYEDGGAIDIAVKDAGNTIDRDAVRSHLPHIATMFGRGDLSVPMLVHDTKGVPGADVLSARKDTITYRYVETPKGGRVDIMTSDPETLRALHDFLRYQIREHHTGDTGTVERRPQRDGGPPLRR